jgi:hypothetical protein
MDSDGAAAELHVVLSYEPPQAVSTTDPINTISAVNAALTYFLVSLFLIF